MPGSTLTLATLMYFPGAGRLECLPARLAFLPGLGPYLTEVGEVGGLYPELIVRYALARRTGSVVCVFGGAPAWPGPGVAGRRRLLRPQGAPSFMTQRAFRAAAHRRCLKSGGRRMRFCLSGRRQGGPCRGTRVMPGSPLGLLSR